MTADRPVETPQQAARRLAQKMLGKGFEPEALHVYNDASGRPLFWRIRARNAKNGEKWIRPMHINGQGFELGEPRFEHGKPLYNLDLLAKQPQATVWLLEGEKPCDWLRAAFEHLGVSNGHVPTTSGGATSAARADWSPLRGRHVVLWPDNDGPGTQYGRAAAAELSKIGATVEVIDAAKLGLPVGGDVVDWHEAHQDATMADLGGLPRLTPKSNAAQEHNAPSPSPDRGESAPHLLEHGFWVRDAKLTTALPYVVKGLFGKGQIIVVWGQPGSGKSFAMTALACAVGAGVPWCGRRTKRGTVIYVAAESARAYIENRVFALCREWPAVANADVLIVPVALDLLHAERGDVDRVIETAKLLTREVGEVALIVVDTLSVTMGGGNENNEDMAQYVLNVLQIRAETGAAVLLIHHGGKDESRGMRGHTALLAAIDAELAVEWTPGQRERILRVGKLRDGPGFTDLCAFTLRALTLGKDPDGDPITTCVVDTLDSTELAKARRERKGSGLGKHQKAALRIVEEVGGRIPRIDLAGRLKDDRVSRNRISEAIGALLENGILVADNAKDPPEVYLP